MAKSRIVIIDQLSSSDAGLGAFMSKYNISSVVKLNLTVQLQRGWDGLCATRS